MKKIPYDEKLMIGEAGFCRKWLSKLLFTLISVKVWGLAASMIVSTYLLLIHKEGVEGGILETGITGAQWVTFNTTIWALIFGMKEIFRITEKKDKDEMEALKQQGETKKQIASIVTNGDSKKSKVKLTADGKEIVGEEPDA